MQPQKSFGEFVSDRYGPKWVYAARTSDRIKRQYPDSVVITPKQQRQLQVDYAKVWGREHDPAFWAMLCALRCAKEAFELLELDRQDARYQNTCRAIDDATTYRRYRHARISS